MTCLHPSAVVTHYYMAPAGDLSIEELRRQADDSRASTSVRCKAIITLFGRHVQLESSSREVAKILGEAQWLSNANSSIRPIIAGPPTPVDDQRGSAFYLSLFPSQMSGQQRVSMCFLLSGLNMLRTPGSSDADSSKQLLRFLKGDIADKEVRILEYAIIWMNGDNRTTVSVKDGDVSVTEMQRHGGKPVAVQFKLLTRPRELELSPTRTWNLSDDGVPSSGTSR